MSQPFDLNRLREAIPDLVLQSFENLDDWKTWVEENPWVRDESYIDRIRASASANGVRSLWFGPIEAQKVSVSDRRISVGHLSDRKRMVLDLIQSMNLSRDARIYAAEALSEMVFALRGRYPYFLGSEFYPENPSALFPIPHQDLTNLSLPSSVFDLAITIEVLEHVPFLGRALAELARILRPGGTMISTIPFLAFSQDTQCRARLVNGEIEHLVETPEYHMDPHRKDGALVFNLCGWDVLDMAKQAGFARARFFFFSTILGGVTDRRKAGVFAMVCQK